jgi:hypothetical protein
MLTFLAKKHPIENTSATKNLSRRLLKTVINAVKNQALMSWGECG